MKSENKKILCLALLLFLIWFLPAQAQPYQPLAPIPGVAPAVGAPKSLAQYAANAFFLLLGVAGGLAVIMIMIGGLKYITAADSEERTKDAKDQITKAVFGLILAAGSWLILYTINPDLISLRLDVKPIEAPPAAPPTTTPPTIRLWFVVKEEWEYKSGKYGGLPFTEPSCGKLLNRTSLGGSYRSLEDCQRNLLIQGLPTSPIPAFGCVAHSCRSRLLPADS